MCLWLAASILIPPLHHCQLVAIINGVKCIFYLCTLTCFAMLIVTRLYVVSFNNLYK